VIEERFRDIRERVFVQTFLGNENVWTTLGLMAAFVDASA
jgi:hypothetical protein